MLPNNRMPCGLGGKFNHCIRKLIGYKTGGRRTSAMKFVRPATDALDLDVVDQTKPAAH
jgi:hypothetical protein